ncbi:MAG: murein biosynthesis integral membrane protein MurJ [Firmicutes bacterium HGW-Firmicutes-1]|jgi:putative peptidoglycan lipid II flippase|nr:MAG: murein biosynthesis integral membrane protein MurJ [Firmicutes bacterium HGW-Firmicutes-1]
MRKAALVIMIITIISKVFGFMREVALSYYYGASELTDVYLIAITISATLFSFLFTAITNTFIPMYGRIKNDDGEKAANYFTSNLINMSILLSGVLILIVFLFTTPLVKIFAVGFEGETLELAIVFTRLNVIGVLASGALAILMAFLQVKDRFVIPALVGFPLNFAVIAAIVISHKTNSSVLIWGTMLSSFLQLLFVLPSVYKLGYRHRAVISIKDEHIKTMLVLAMPVIIGTSVNQINTLVDRTLASSVVVGGISALSYAAKLNGFVQGMFVYSIVVVIYPKISQMASEGRDDELKIVVAKSINAIMLLILPATVGTMVFARPIVQMMFGQGAFDERAVVLTTGALFFYSIGMVAFGVQEVLSRTFYALQDTKTPMYNGVLTVVINIILNIVLSQVMGISGLALATSISAVICSVLLIRSLRKKTGQLGIKKILMSSIKILIASVIMGAGSYFSYHRLISGVGHTLGLFIAIAIGVLLYGAIILAMKVPEIEEIIIQIRGKTRKKHV